MTTPLDSLCASLLVTAHRLTRIAAQTTGSTTPSAVWNTLSILSTSEPLRVGDLANTARVTQPSMTKLVHQLSDDGLVLKIADRNDSRAWLVTITDRGRNALEEWRQTLGRALGPMFADLEDSDIQTLTRAVELLRSRTSINRTAA
ncbi:MarR family transcriptional regulator [Parafrigoribacterium mesophilum]|uniref:MarR family winged helix-turn-helix transcriptional regulator n=1 Tax=Parafrigoribacterium mesophilum TaxID=433646 RepID=UPI0031FDB9BE